MALKLPDRREMARRTTALALICAECDPPLWTIENGELQIGMEQLWNVIADRYDVKILCGYSMGSGPGKINRELCQRICAEHSAVHFSEIGGSA